VVGGGVGGGGLGGGGGGVGGSPHPASGGSPGGWADALLELRPVPATDLGSAGLQGLPAQAAEDQGAVIVERAARSSSELQGCPATSGGGAAAQAESVEIARSREPIGRATAPQLAHQAAQAGAAGLMEPPSLGTVEACNLSIRLEAAAARLTARALQSGRCSPPKGWRRRSASGSRAAAPIAAADQP